MMEYVGGYYHIVDGGKVVCNGDDARDARDVSIGDNSPLLCKKCKVAVSGDMFDIHVFGNQRMIDVMMAVRDGKKRMFEMRDIVEASGKPHIMYELNKLVDCGYLDKVEHSYYVSDKGQIAVFICDLIMSLKNIDVEGVQKILAYLKQHEVIVH